MEEGLKFDYYYGVQSEQFSFYRIPRLLIKDQHFKGLSSDAKLLYGLMLDRMALSMKNHWLDNKKGQYRISVVEAGIGDVDVTDTKAVSGIKLPDAGKAQSVTIEGGAEGNAAKQLAVQGAVSYKGTLELEHVSVNADSAGAITRF